MLNKLPSYKKRLQFCNSLQKGQRNAYQKKGQRNVQWKLKCQKHRLKSYNTISAQKKEGECGHVIKTNRARPSGDQRPAAGRAHPPRGPLLAAADRGHAPPAPCSAGPRLLAPRRAPRGPAAGPSSSRLVTAPRSRIRQPQEREIEGVGEEGEKGRPDAEACTPPPRARRRHPWPR